MKTTVSEKGQITIPKNLRLRLGLRKGQVLEVREEEGKLVMTKTTSTDPFQKYYGVLDLGLTTDEIMTQLRGEKFPRDHRRR
jgi:antitoxin PrlF